MAGKPGILTLALALDCRSRHFSRSSAPPLTHPSRSSAESFHVCCLSFAAASLPLIASSLQSLAPSSLLRDMDTSSGRPALRLPGCS
eukprot:scaffold51572_cov67-Phaeocystis_antarctica.AAC.2